MAHRGHDGLSDVEMLQLALRVDAEKARGVLERAGDLGRLVGMTTQELQGLGLGAASAERFAASLEIHKRSTAQCLDVLSCPGDVWPYLHEIRDKPIEHFCCLYLNARNVLMKRQVISIGSVSASIVHPREVFQIAISSMASSVILAHNHPSGEVTPSRDDIELTKRLVDGGRLLGIEVIDHIVVCPHEFLSLKERGLM